MRKWKNADLESLREIGWALWDPIGLKSITDAEDMEFIADEYDSYLVRTAGILINGGSESDAADYLVTVERDEMDLGEGGRDRALATVRALKSYLDNR